MNIGNKIKELRLERTLTQEQLAGFLSVSTQCISKWENDVTMPDIQMLPQISTFFGVTIDELFDLTDDAHINRIQNMIENKRLIEEEEFYQAEKFLLKKERENETNAKYPSVLADLYNYMADSYRYLAEIKAKKAIELAPDKKYNHTLLRMAQQGKQMDWNFDNNSRRINYYKKFVNTNPSIERGYVCLLDELIAANRFEEAEDVIAMMSKNISTLRLMFYKGYLSWVRNDREQAWEIWNQMLSEYNDSWLACALIGDCMANYCEYEKAIEYYEKSLELQKAPRYTDSQMSIAMIYEIVGNRDSAIKSWEKVLDILVNEHKVTEGKNIDAVKDEISRLKKE